MTEKRNPFVPADDLSKLWRAIIEFDMLAPGDRILIGLSGGKDSMFLTAALAEIKKYSPIFEWSDNLKNQCFRKFEICKMLIIRL